MHSPWLAIMHGWRSLLASFHTGSLSLILSDFSASTLPANLAVIVPLTLGITGFLCLLNIALAILFRKRHKQEVLTYYAACVVELLIFVVTLLIYIGVISTAPFHLLHGLPINQAEIGAALAIGVGLFPAAYWHRVNLSDLPARIAQDGREMKKQNAGRIHDISQHGEWMN
jgi:hypothetical protein